MALKRKTDQDPAPASASASTSYGFGSILKRLRETGQFTPLISDSTILPGLGPDDRPAIETKPEPEPQEPYTGIPSAEIERIWKIAIDLPWQDEPYRLLELAKTEIGYDPVLAIWIATKYLRRQQTKPQLYNAQKSLSFQKRLEHLQWKKDVIHRRERKSERHERWFLDAVRRVFPDMADEEEQFISLEVSFQNGEPGYYLTPDILFPKPTMFFGKMCRWVDYKNALGFKCSPKSYLREHNQAKNYSEVFGPGMLVYKHGFEQGLHQIEGVTCAREKEVLEWLEQERLNAQND